MKTTTAYAIISAAMWLGVTAAVIVALVFTQNISVFWFYLMPSIWGCHLKPKCEVKETGNND